MKDNPIKQAFIEVQADENLMKQTMDYVNNQRNHHAFGKQNHPMWRLAGAFAVFAVLIMGGATYSLGFVPAAHVSIDVNPSLELTLNRVNRVMSVDAFNTEGEQILSGIDWKGKRYDEAAALIVTAVDHAGYMMDDALVSVTVQTNNSKAEQVLCDNLLQAVHQSIDKRQKQAAVEVYPVKEETWQAAHGCRMSPAKYAAIQELLEVDEEATLDGYSDSSLRQIRRRIGECQKKHENNSGDITEHDGNEVRQGHRRGGNGGHGYHGGK